jgi:hypothetical protein
MNDRTTTLVDALNNAGMIAWMEQGFLAVMAQGATYLVKLEDNAPNFYALIRHNFYDVSATEDRLDAEAIIARLRPRTRPVKYIINNTKMCTAVELFCASEADFIAVIGNCMNELMNAVTMFTGAMLAASEAHAK